MRIQFREYGSSGPKVILLHGGPGAPGYMAPVARALAETFQVIEPFQRRSGGEKLTVARHIADLRELVAAHGSPPSAASDVFSLGLVIFALLTARCAVACGAVLEVLEKIQTLKGEEITLALDEPFRSLLCGMLAPDPELRITMMDVGRLRAISTLR